MNNMDRRQALRQAVIDAIKQQEQVETYTFTCNIIHSLVGKDGLFFLERYISWLKKSRYFERYSVFGEVIVTLSTCDYRGKEKMFNEFLDSYMGVVPSLRRSEHD